VVSHLDETQRQGLLEIADRCPVHRMLKESSHITTVYLKTVASGEPEQIAQPMELAITKGGELN